MRWFFRRRKQKKVKIPIKQIKNREHEGKTYYKRRAFIPTKLSSGKGRFKLVLSKRAKYLLLTFE